jgi:hypothetical protein
LHLHYTVLSRNPLLWCSIRVYPPRFDNQAPDTYSRTIRINSYISEVWFDLRSFYLSLYYLPAIPTSPSTSAPTSVSSMGSSMVQWDTCLSLLLNPHAGSTLEAAAQQNLQLHHPSYEAYPEGARPRHSFKLQVKRESGRTTTSLRFPLSTPLRLRDWRSTPTPKSVPCHLHRNFSRTLTFLQTLLIAFNFEPIPISVAVPITTQPECSGPGGGSRRERRNVLGATPR